MAYSPDAPRGPVRQRSARGASGEYAIDELSVLQNGNAVDEHKGDAGGRLQRIVIGGFVDDARGIENGDVRVRADFDAALILEGRRALLEPLRGQQGHLAQ